MDMNSLPMSVRTDIERAASGLKALGATEVFLFGSFSDDTWNDRSDIDIAVRGLDPSLFFKAYALASRGLGRELDLIDLDHEKPLAAFLTEFRDLVRIA